MKASKKQKIIGWVITIMIGIFLIGPSAAGKFIDWPGKEEMFGKLGFSTEQMFKIGVLEIILTVLNMIPRTSFLGCILLTGYIGGATCTHVRVSDPFIFPIVIGVVMWVGYALRYPVTFRLLLGSDGTNAGQQSVAES